MNETDDPLTDQDKINLLTFWEVYNARNNPLLDDPWTPDFGHYPPTLLFTDEEDPAGQPDDHYYQAAGQEPPTAAPEGFRASMLKLWRSKEFRAFLGVMALFLVMLVVYGN